MTRRGHSDARPQTAVASATLSGAVDGSYVASEPDGEGHEVAVIAGLECKGIQG